MDEFRSLAETVVNLKVVEERLTNFTEESTREIYGIRDELKSMRTQTHDWMQVMVNRLPPWAVAMGSLMVASFGAMITFILTHRCQ